MVTVCAWGPALSQPVDAWVGGGGFGFTGQLHRLVGLNQFVHRSLLDCRAAMESYEKQKEQRPSARFPDHSGGVSQ